MDHDRSRQRAIQKAQMLLAKRPAFLDTETTGFRNHDEIVEICLIDHDGATLFDGLVRPTRKIPRDAERIHGISNRMVVDMPTWAEVWPIVKDFLAGQSVGIYNANFDLRLIQQSHKAVGLRWQPIGANAFCIMKLYAEFYGDWDRRRRSYRWQSLEDAGAQCGIDLPNSHRALADTILARAILHHMANY